MSLLAQFDRLHAFLQNLECLDMEGQRDAFMNEVMESGGSYVPPAGDNWSSHLFEISLHGVMAYGASEDDAIRNWKIAARAQTAPTKENHCEANHLPFPDPRNHAEEIANAQAMARAEAY